MTWHILQGDARLIPLADKSVQCVVTSPPYWGLRDYGIDSQIGLERAPEEYVGKMVEVFREIKRVLRDDGTVWLNLGNSYCNPVQSGGGDPTIGVRNLGGMRQPMGRKIAGLKPKDLVGIPWRVAFALQADGWYLRSDIIWSKPNPMPESVTDRPTKAHEYIFLLAKKERYYFDQDAVREAATYGSPNSPESIASPYGQGFTRRAKDYRNGAGGTDQEESHVSGGFPRMNDGRNIRSVWEIATQPYPEAHFATFPEEIAERCIRAGTSEKGCCSGCGKPWERVMEDTPEYAEFKQSEKERKGGGMRRMRSDLLETMGLTRSSANKSVSRQSCTLGWQASCKCDAPSVPCTVLDPFAGAGTTPLVADKLNRRGIGLELKLDYCRMAKRRCYDDAPLLTLCQV